MIPRPTTTSAAATTSTKNTTTWPPTSSSVLGERDEGEVDGVEHQLDAHEHHERVAPHQQADGAEREEQRGEHEVPGRRDLDDRERSSVVSLAGRRPARLGVRARTTAATTAITSSTEVISKANR